MADFDGYEPDPKQLEEFEKMSKRYDPNNKNGNGNGKSKRKQQRKNQDQYQQHEPQKRTFYIQKYSSGGGPLSESVIIGGSQPFFLQIINGDPVLQEKLELNDIILQPKDRHSYFNEPYIYDSRDDVVRYLDLAKKITNFDPIFKLVKNIFKKYVDAEDHYITLLAADTIYSYFQDKFATTHYLICIGDNSSGKNSILTTFANLGYRVFLATSVSAANVYTFLGCIEDCQGSIAEDELNHIEDDPDKMNVHKSGYSRSSGKIPKTDLHSGRTQETYLTYCFKIFASEELPESSKAKGILDRSFVIQCIAGRPQFNIKDVFENTNDEKYVRLRNELDKTRKLLLAYRMLHFNDTIKDVNLNIYNREAELTKPLIRLFRESPEVLQELLPALTKVLNAKRDVKSGSLEAKLYTAITNLIADHSDDYTIDHESIITQIRDITNGEDSVFGEQAFYTTDLGKITHRRVIDVLVDKFKAIRTSKGSGKEKKRALKFNKDDLAKKGREYDVPDKIEILLPPEGTNNEDYEPDSFDNAFLVADSNNNGTQGTQGTESEDIEEDVQLSEIKEITSNQD